MEQIDKELQEVYDLIKKNEVKRVEEMKAGYMSVIKKHQDNEDLIAGHDVEHNWKPGKDTWGAAPKPSIPPRPTPPDSLWPPGSE